MGLLRFSDFGPLPRRRLRGMGEAPYEWTADHKDAEGRWVSTYGQTWASYTSQYGAPGERVEATSPSDPRPGVTYAPLSPYSVQGPDLVMGVDYPAEKPHATLATLLAQGGTTPPPVTQPQGVVAALAAAGIKPMPQGTTVAAGTPPIAAQQPFAQALQNALQPIALQQRADPMSYLSTKTRGFVDEYGSKIAWGAGGLAGLYALVQIVKAFAPRGAPPPVVQSNPRRRRRRG